MEEEKKVKEEEPDLLVEVLGELGEDVHGVQQLVGVQGRVLAVLLGSGGQEGGKKGPEVPGRGVQTPT